MTQNPIRTYCDTHGITFEQFGAMFDPPVDKSTVSRWQRRIPAERAVEVEEKTGIPRAKQRPDLWGRN